MTSRRSPGRLVPAILSAFAIAWSAPATAQSASYRLQGRVVDAASREGLSGAQVSLRGTQYGTVTAADGAYTLEANVPRGNYTLVYSYVGRATEQHPVTLADQSTITIPEVALSEKAVSLEAVIVTGTASPTAKRALGNSVASVGSDELAQAPVTTVDQALQGKVAGAVITSNTGTPGGGVSVRLRGTSSIIGGAEPLYIVDGVILDNSGDQQINFGYRSNPSNRLADLDPNDIDHIEILKGAAAAALYGSRANNGVVQIFTKRGQSGEAHVSGTTRFTWGSLPKHIDFALTPLDTEGNPVQRYDPQDLIFRDALSNDTHVSVSGGTPATQYYVSGGYTSNQGIMKGSDYTKEDVRLNLDQSLGGKLKVSAGANYIRSHNDLVINGEQGVGGLLTAIVFTPTTVDLSARNPETGQLLNTAYVFPNPLDVLDRWDNGQDISRFVGSLQLHANPLNQLTLQYRLGYDTYSMETSQFIPRGATLAPLGSATNYDRGNYLVNNDLIGTYDVGAGSAQFTTSVGMNHTFSHRGTVFASASDVSPGTKLVRGANMSSSESQVETVTLGFFGQEQIGFNNRLFLTGALRWDASSTFGPDERWQLYPKVSGSYVISDEGFWQNSGLAGVLPQFRIRAALGYAGNQPPTDLAYTRFSRYGPLINVSRLGLVPLSEAGNADLKPERQREIEAGFDASILSDRVNLTFTYYDQHTTDLLLPRPYAPSTGYSSGIIDNVGSLSNKGVELQLNTDNVRGNNFRWSSSFILSHNKNVVDSLFGSPYTVGYNNRVQQGEELGAFYMSADSVINGVVQTDDLGPLRGGSRIVGSPWPDVTASINNEFGLGDHWSASFLLDGSFGQKVWNQTQRIMDIFGAGPNYDRYLRGEITNDELVRYYGTWSHYLEDASYVKLRDVRLGYHTSGDWVRNLGVSEVQLELVGHDLLTFSDYSGYDPEVNMFGLSTVERGVDFAVYPHARTVGVSLRVTY